MKEVGIANGATIRAFTASLLYYEPTFGKQAEQNQVHGRRQKNKFSISFVYQISIHSKSIAVTFGLLNTTRSCDSYIVCLLAP